MNEDYVVPIIHSESEYVKPIKYGDEISVNVQVSQLKTSSFELTYVIKREKELCCHAKTVHVFVDKKSWKKQEMFKDLTEGLKIYRT